MSERCALCGGELAHDESTCGRCPLSSGCDMLRCTNCGYETVAARSVTVDFFQRVADGFRRLVRRGGADATGKGT